MTNKAVGCDFGIITTFGLYVGITHNADWSDISQSNDRKFFDAISDNKHLHILIGVADYKVCYKNIPCQGCSVEYLKRHLRLLHTAKHYSNLKFYLSPNEYSKIAVFMTGNSVTAFVGSHNLSGSDFTDTVVEFDGNLEILNISTASFDKSIRLTDESLFAYFEKQTKYGLDITLIDDLYNGTLK